MTVATGFFGQRAQLYTEALSDFPDVRAVEVAINLAYIKPNKGEKFLEVGSGSGLYTKILAPLVKELVATDPSEDQLENLKTSNIADLRTIQVGADLLHENEILVHEKGSFDAVWSLGAFHHCSNKTQAFANFRDLLKTGGRILICDVFSGSTFADYFDAEVALFSIIGHEVAFLTEHFARSLCAISGFSKPRFISLDYPWVFKNLQDLGLFMYKLHGMTKTTPEQCLESVGKFMKIEKSQDGFILHVPLVILETYKL